MKNCVSIGIALAALALSGCAAMQTASRSNGTAAPPPAPPAPASPALAAVASGVVGSATTVEDPALGGQVDLQVTGEYWAASGKTCKRVYLQPLAGGFAEGRTACQGASGWYWVEAGRA